MKLNHEQLWPILHARLREYMAVSNWDVETIVTGTGSTLDTVTGWLADREPNGERLIKLWHILAATGCESPELKQVGALNFLCGQLLTFGIMSMEELQETIGVTNQQAVLRMLRGGEPLRWYYNSEELTALYGDQLNDALARIPKLDVSKKSTSIEKTKTTSQVQETQHDVPASGTKSGLLLASACQLSALLPVVRHLDSDACTPQDRSRLRSLLGEDGMFELSNHFNALCSERARNNGR